MIFSRPYRCDSRSKSVKREFSRSTSRDGERRADRLVNPTRSANRMVASGTASAITVSPP